MNEPVLLPSPDESVPPADAAPPPPPPPVEERRPRRDALPWLAGVGFLILAGAIAYLWVNMVPADQLAHGSNDLAALGQRISDLDARVTRVEQRPPQEVTPADLAKLSARMNEIDGHVANQAQLASQLDALSGRIQSLSARDQAALDDFKQQLADLSNQVKAEQSAASSLEAVSQRIDRIGKLQQASFALSNGRPVGDVPGALPALAKYAQIPPPTEAQLRLSFAQAEANALGVPHPDAEPAPFMDRVWEKAQGLVTVRRGNEIVVGDTTAMTLNKAQTALQAGDLEGAIKAVEAIKGAPAQAMAGWLAEAKALFNAKAALVQMAAQS